MKRKYLVHFITVIVLFFIFYTALPTSFAFGNDIINEISDVSIWVWLVYSAIFISFICLFILKQRKK